MSPVTAPLPRSAARHAAPAGRLAALVRLAAAGLRDWRARARSRRELRELDDALLRDLALPRAQASFDADRPFWRA